MLYWRRLRACLSNTQFLEATRIRRTTSQDFPSLSLLNVGRKPGRTWYARYDKPPFLFAAHGKERLHNSHSCSFLCLEPRNQQQTKKSLPLSTFPTIAVCGHGHTWSVAKNIRRAVDSRDIRLVIVTNRDNTNWLKNCNCIRYDILRPLDFNIRYLSMILTDIGSPPTSEFFQAICSELRITPPTTTEYHPKTNERADQYNETIIYLVRHYVSNQQQYWEGYIAPLTHACNFWVHDSK